MPSNTMSSNEAIPYPILAVLRNALSNTPFNPMINGRLEDIWEHIQDAMNADPVLKEFILHLASHEPGMLLNTRRSRRNYNDEPGAGFVTSAYGLISNGQRPPPAYSEFPWPPAPPYSVHDQAASAASPTFNSIAEHAVHDTLQVPPAPPTGPLLPQPAQPATPASSVPFHTQQTRQGRMARMREFGRRISTRISSSLSQAVHTLTPSGHASTPQNHGARRTFLLSLAEHLMVSSLMSQIPPTPLLQSMEPEMPVLDNIELQDLFF